MIIYQDTKAGFLSDIADNYFAARIEAAFLKMTGSIPVDGRGWANDYARFANVLSQTAVADDVRIAIEYHCSPVGRSRIDVLLMGNDGHRDNALIVELKAWDTASVSDVDGMVVCPIAGGSTKQHPSLQALNYKGMILRFNEDIPKNDVGLHSSAYLFNLYRRTPEPLEDSRYAPILSSSQLFLADDNVQFRAYLEKHIPVKAKSDILFLLENGRWRPTDELIARVDSMLHGNEEFILLDEQDEAFRLIRHEVLSEVDRSSRHVFVIEGGPGTGKSVIAIRLLAETLKKKRMSFLVAPNKAFRDALVASLTKDARSYRDDGAALFQSSWSFHQADWRRDARNEILIVDEAHRLKDAAYQYKGKSMVDDMVRASRISVFFIDESQQVSWNDAGSVAAIKAAAAKHGAKFHPPLKLTAQFRCNGSTGYLNWLDDVLHLRQTGNFDNWGDGQYDFQVFDRAEELHAALKARNDRNKARLIAGYTWEWPTHGRSRGTSVKHVRADGLALPWNFDDESWAASPDGIEQVGCVHTSQGLEFDWMGVLIGDDLRYADGRVVGDPARRAKTDASLKGWKAAFSAMRGDAHAQAAVMNRVDKIIKSTYRVLLSRGRLGTYVWCQDAALRDYFKARIQGLRRI